MEAPGIEPSGERIDTPLSAGFEHVKGEANMQTSTPKYAEGRDADESRTNRSEGRARMLANLAADMRGALDAGDLEAVRVANEAMERLLGDSVSPSG